MFSNGTEYMIWQERNCDCCAKYENESTEVWQAGCRIAFYIDRGSVGGELPPDVDEITEMLDCPELETFEEAAERKRIEKQRNFEILCGQGYLFKTYHIMALNKATLENDAPETRLSLKLRN